MKEAKHGGPEKAVETKDPAAGKPAGVPAEGKPSQEDKIRELTGLLQRLQAEFENASKRMEKEKKEFFGYANAAFVRELLPFADSLEQAAGKAEKESQGLALLRKQFLDILGGHGFREIKAAGEKFDPRLHEAMMNAADKTRPDGVVVEELQKGYLLRDLILRPSKVKVNKLS